MSLHRGATELCRLTPVLGISRQTQGDYTRALQLERDEEHAEV